MSVDPPSQDLVRKAVLSLSESAASLPSTVVNDSALGQVAPFEASSLLWPSDRTSDSGNGHKSDTVSSLGSSSTIGPFTPHPADCDCIVCFGIDAGLNLDGNMSLNSSTDSSEDGDGTPATDAVDDCDVALVVDNPPPDELRTGRHMYIVEELFAGRLRKTLFPNVISHTLFIERIHEASSTTPAAIESARSPASTLIVSHEVLNVEDEPYVEGAGIELQVVPEVPEQVPALASTRLKSTFSSLEPTPYVEEPLVPQTIHHHFASSPPTAPRSYSKRSRTGKTGNGLKAKSSRNKAINYVTDESDEDVEPALPYGLPPTKKLRFSDKIVEYAYAAASESGDEPQQVRRAEVVAEVHDAVVDAPHSQGDTTTDTEVLEASDDEDWLLPEVTARLEREAALKASRRDDRAEALYTGPDLREHFLPDGSQDSFTEPYINPLVDVQPRRAGSKPSRLEPDPVRFLHSTAYRAASMQNWRCSLTFISFYQQIDVAVPADIQKSLCIKVPSPPEYLEVVAPDNVNFQEQDTNDPAYLRTFKRLLVTGAKHHIPQVFLRSVWDDMASLFEQSTGFRPRAFSAQREKVLKTLPGCKIHYTMESRADGSRVVEEDSAFRRSKYPAHKFDMLMCETVSSITELLVHHASLHMGPTGQKLLKGIQEKRDVYLYFYIDGVSPSTSGSQKMICQVLRLPDCRKIYNFNTILYLKEYNITGDDLLRALIVDLKANPNFHIRLLLADMPERCRMTGSISHCGYFGCNICFCRGEPRPGGGGGMCFPPWTTAANLRDQKSFLLLAAKARATGLPTGGQKVPAPVLKIPGFHIPTMLGIDPMHLLQGLSKYLWEAFGKKYLTPAQFESLSRAVSVAYTSIHIPSDFKRSPRAINSPKFRANEWKQLVLLVGVNIGDEYDDFGYRKVGEFWRRYSFIVRLLSLGDGWYHAASSNGELLEAQIAVLYDEVEKLLGKEFCTPNLHALSHMPEWRSRYSLRQLTTEVAEDFYGRNRRSFREQSPSVGKQIHYNGLLASKVGHVCQPVFKYGPRLTTTSMDHILVDNRSRCFYYEAESTDQRYYKVRRILVSHYTSRGGTFNWRSVGIFRVQGVSRAYSRVLKATIIARGLITPSNCPQPNLSVWTRDMHDW